MDRFDLVLQQFGEEYGLNSGPQTKPFGTAVIQKSVDTKVSVNFSEHGFSSEGDRELIECILNFTCLLLEKCGNRSLYSSSSHLNDLLNTTSLTLLEATLRLSLHLAQRYHASRTRLGSMSHNAGLLASHYNINLDKVNKIASPFAKDLSLAPGTASGVKSNDPSHITAQNTFQADPADIVALVKRYDDGNIDWTQYLGVSIRYYQTSENIQAVSAKEPAHAPDIPASPTNIRRSTSSAPTTTSKNLRNSLVTGAAGPSSGSNSTRSQDSSSAHSKMLQIRGDLIDTTPLTELLKIYLPNLPSDVRYDLLTRLRTSHAIGSSAESRKNVVIIRLLAIANLAYIYPEATFQQKIAQVDIEEPRRFQLPYQLAELLQPSDSGQTDTPRQLQTVALYALEALTRQKSKSADVGSALSIGVNHGVLSYVIRKAVKEIWDPEAWTSEEDYEWRNALFALIMSLPNSNPRAGESLISAGLLDSLMEILKVRNTKSERHSQDVLTFLDVYIYNIRNAFQALINASGLDIIADKIAYSVTNAYCSFKNGMGMPKAYMTRMTDFKVSFYSQQNLRWLFKFTNHMLSHGGGNFDRLLRNLIGSPQLLGALRQVIENAQIFGSNIWTGAVNIMVNLIHNEPTSYAIFAEAGLSKLFLDTISMNVEKGARPTTTDMAGKDQQQNTGNRDEKPTYEALKPVDVQEILPSAEVITVIPQLFGAICLIESGMNLFQTSDALQTFFGIFVSREHMKVLNSEQDVAATLGNAFDELVRHHPQLKDAVLDAVQNMVLRVALTCFERACMYGSGTKLWLETDDGRAFVAGGFESLKGEEGPLHRRARFAKETFSQISESRPENEESGMAEQPNSLIAWKDELQSNLKEEPEPIEYVNVTCKFLKGFLGNSSLCGSFIERGTFEYVLDLATLPFWPPNIHGDGNDAGDIMARIIQIMVEQKPHLVLPQIMNRLRSTLSRLDVLTAPSNEKTYLSQFTYNDISVSQAENPPGSLAQGTRVAKALVASTMICTALGISFQEPIFQPRSSSSLFSQVNLADVYVDVIQKLGVLYQACIKEEFELQRSMPLPSKGKMGFLNSLEASGDAANMLNILNATQHLEFAEDIESANKSATTLATNQKSGTNDSENSQTARNLNKKNLRHMLTQATNSIAAFFQGVGRSLLLKRTIDIYQKQNATSVANQLAKTFTDTLCTVKDIGDRGTYSRYACWVVVLSSITGSMTDNCM